VHKLGCDQPKTTKELLDIAIHYPSGEEAIRVVFILGDGKTVLDAGRGGGGTIRSHRQRRQRQC
jgi:hypothetical protein